MLCRLFFIILSLLLFNLGFSSSVVIAEEPTPQQQIQRCTELIKQNPKDSRSYEARAFWKGTIGDFDGSIQDANKALKLNPSSAGAYYVRGSAYAILSEKVEFGPHELRTKAINDYTKCLELGGPRADAYFFRGKVKACTREYDAAIGDFTAVISMQPDNAEAYFYRAGCYYAKKDTKTAYPDFKKAAELDPNNEKYQKYLSLY